MLSEARESVAGVLATIPDLNTYASPPTVISAPAAVVSATEDPWVVVKTATQYQVALTITLCVVQGGGNDSNYEALERIVVAVLERFPQATAVSQVSAARSGQTDLVQVSISVTVLVSEG